MEYLKYYQKAENANKFPLAENVLFPHLVSRIAIRISAALFIRISWMRTHPHNCITMPAG